MSKEAIVERIVSDAEAEAETILQNARGKAAATIAAASARAEQGRRDSEAEVKEKRESILDRKAAAARLECAKILLSEKRRVIDGVYAEALKRLNALDKAECLALTARLLTEYAEEGDVIEFAENYPCAEDAARLPVTAEKKLSVSSRRAKIDGGFLLYGVSSDKNLSYGALLAADREEYQAEIAAELFKD